MRVLVLDDEALIAIDTAELLADLGHEVVGPFSELDSAMKEVEAEIPDFGLLDFNLGCGVTSAPLADRLACETVPFAFLTGYRRGDLPDRFCDVPLLSKPLQIFEVRQLVGSLAP